jgi:hypothetical protein
MGARGRKSGAEISIFPLVNQRRPELPAELTKAQARTWKEIVAAMPADWFARAPELLIQCCRHVSAANFIAKEINTFEPWPPDAAGLKRYGWLLAMAQRESALMSSLATKMRLTQQSRWSAKTASTAVRNNPTGLPPWVE